MKSGITGLFFNMQAEIINIGDELLIGQVVNTNASWIAEQYNLVGISINRITVIADEKESIINALNNASLQADIILITGGLGPTNDDITKKVLCDYFDSKLILNKDVLDDIQTFFQKRNFEVTFLNQQQAEVPDKCIPIRNYNGTAPGMWFEKNNKIFISLPGVPFEMKAIISNYVLPEITKRFKLPVIIHKTILTQGIGESFLADKIRNWENNLPEFIKLAYLPTPGLVRLRLSAKGNDKNILSKSIDDALNSLQTLISEYIYSYDDDTMEEIIGKLLKQHSLTIATAESCTGGYIASRITSVSGSSAYFKGSIVSYVNEIKIQELNISEKIIIDKGTVSCEVAEAMAQSIQKKFNTHYSIAVTGIAGPDGGTTEKPVGTVWIAIATPLKIISQKFLFGDNRERNVQRTCISALNMLRKAIIIDTL